MEEVDSVRDNSLGDGCDATKPVDSEDEVVEGDWSQPSDPINMRAAKPHVLRWTARGSNFELMITRTV